MEALTRSALIVALLCSTLGGGAARAADKAAGKNTAAGKDTAADKDTAAGKDNAAKKYCCSPQCCELKTLCTTKHDCNGWQKCETNNNGCLCSGPCEFVSADAKKAAASIPDPLPKATAGLSSCEWDCLQRFRNCLKQCSKSTKDGACDKCTTDYTKCKDRCPPPWEPPPPPPSPDRATPPPAPAPAKK
jgi:hypothetical protein